MTALARALGAWLLAMSVAVWVDPNAPDSTAAKVVLSVVSVAGALIFAGLVGRHRGRSRSRELVAAGAVVGGVMSTWAIVPAPVAPALLVWLFAPRRRTSVSA